MVVGPDVVVVVFVWRVVVVVAPQPMTSQQLDCAVTQALPPAGTRHRLTSRCAAVHFSPVHGVLDAKQLAEWILADRLPVRLQLQAHKYIWDAQTRGV